MATKKQILQKVAGIVGSIARHNFKKNKMGMGMSFAMGYLPNKKVGEGINSTLSGGLHYLPGVTGEKFTSEMKKKPISTHNGERGQISESLIKMKQQ